MIKIDASKLIFSVKTILWLQEAQKDIDDPHITDAQRDAKWKNRSRSAFIEIKQKLKKASAAKDKCWYCEANEPKVIDHVAPKSKFPSLTFAVDNFVLACDQCNTHHKKDLFAVFHPQGSAKVLKLEIGKKYSALTTADFAFIHPHHDDPLEFFFLDLKKGIFLAHPAKRLDARATAKAKHTLRILELNRRPSLIRDRSYAVNAIELHLQRFLNIQETKNVQELIKLIPIPDESINEATFLKTKRRALRKQKALLLQASHISVLHEMHRQANHFPNLKRYQSLIAQILA